MLLVIAVYLVSPHVTLFMNDFAKDILSSYLSANDINILEKTFVNTVYIIDMPGKYPSMIFSVCLLIASLLLIFLISKTKLPPPIVIWVIYLALINLVSSVVFILMPAMFPYIIENFSELYIKTEVVIWLFIPLLMGIAFSSLPSNIFTKTAVVVLTIIYSMVLGIIRYVAFLYILAKFSYIFMAFLFFAFGPLMDFIYIVGLYSLYVSNYASKIGKDLRIWKWLS
ncbi:MAG: hypothetical protein HZC10_01505 [Nitrospirae bacterium]|nr:hypothetical protein [Nitrospirota bacterium]